MKVFNTSLSRWLGASVALVSLAHNCEALDPGRTVSQYATQAWGAAAGFPKGRVDSITQSSDGYLWIGTEHGLLRFDGETFTSIRDQSGDPFSLDHILGLTSDERGNLWIRLQAPSLLRYRNGVFTVERPHPFHDPLVTAMAPAPDGSILFASQADGVFAWKGVHFEPLLTKGSLPASPITSIAQTANKDIWLGTRDSGLFRLRDKRLEPIANGLPSLKINCLLEGLDGQVFVGTDRGLVRWDGSKLSKAGVPAALLATPVFAMTRDRDANIWIGAGNGLLRLNSQGASLRKDAAGKAITALFEDREGDLWAGSSDRLERIQESAFTTYQAENGGPIFTDSSGRIWTAPVSGGLYYLRGGTLTELPLRGLRHEQVYSIAGSNDDLWLGLRRQALIQITSSGDQRSLTSYKQASGLPQSSIYAVHQNRDKTIWLGTLNAGVSHFQDGRFRNYTTADGLASNTILSIAEDSDGSMWFATPLGLTRFVHDHWTTYGMQDGLPSANLYTLFQDRGEILWIGTLHGLAFLRAGRIQVPAGLPSSMRAPIFGIVEDRMGSLWIATSESILRVDRAKLLAGSLSSEDVREFGAAEGLPEASGVRRERAIAIDIAGRVWFSRADGLASVDPQRLRRTAVPSIVHIERLLVDGNTRKLEDPLRLPPDLKRIAIQYVGLNLSAPSHVRYRFKLDGYDKDWNAPVSNKEAAYTNLSPGAYRFHVMASNADQMWNGQDTELFFNVDPAFWQTLSFRIGCAATLLLVIVALYRLRLRQMTERVHIQFEARFAERTRIARNLHDTLLQSFQGLMLQFQAIHNMLPEEPLEAKESLDEAIDQAARALTEGRDAIQELRSNEASDDLIEALSMLGRELAPRGDDGKHPASYRVLMEGAPRQLHPRLQEDLYRIAREAVGNAFLHARAAHIELDLWFGASALRIRVRDDGVGVDPDILAEGARDGHWGLPGMQERARAINGRLEIWSELKRGTEIELTVPASVAYMKLDRGMQRKTSGDTAGDQ